jgi:hypothetical protein
MGLAPIAEHLPDDPFQWVWLLPIVIMISAFRLLWSAYPKGRKRSKDPALHFIQSL